MKKMKSLLMLMAIAAASFTFTSCDDDPWDDGRYWHDDYGWYEDYNQGGWGMEPGRLEPGFRRFAEQPAGRGGPDAGG